MTKAEFIMMTAAEISPQIMRFHVEKYGFQFNTHQEVASIAMRYATELANQVNEDYYFDDDEDRPDEGFWWRIKNRFRKGNV